MNSQVLVAEDGSESVLVHFAVQYGKTSWAVCSPDQLLGATPEREYPWVVSNDPRAVNCPLCLDTDEHKTAAAEQRANHGKVAR